jgi:pimeloyl-ACP methyl ester carboxylesterase
VSDLGGVLGRSTVISLGNGLAARLSSGDGEVVFWIHGYTLDSTCWSGLWDLLPGFRHIGFDLPGHGNSLPLDPKEDLRVLARRVGALAIARGARHLVAISFGTAIALQIAIEYPDAFATLTLGSPVLGGGPFDRDVWTRYECVKALVAQKGLGSHVLDLWMESGSVLFRSLDVHCSLKEQLSNQVRNHPWWELADDAYRRLWLSPQSLKDLSSIRLSTLLITGAEDCEAVKRSAYQLERAIPHCERRDYPGLGHLCLIEAPVSIQPLIDKHWRSHALRRLETNAG